MSFAGLRVLSLESRRSAEIELLIRKQEGEPFVAPSVRERAVDDDADAFRLLDLLEHKAFDLLILMTGVGLTFWRNVVATRFSSERADEALRHTPLLVRGPKPTAVLRTSGIVPTVTVPEPNTWREIVPLLSQRNERKLAIQEYGKPNPEFVEALRALGATVETFTLYRWELPEDLAPLREAVQRLARRQLDVVLFTSSIQAEHLFEIAREQGLEQEVKSALREHAAIASVGPIMNETLAELGLAADIVPASPKMGPLVYLAAAEAASAIERKREFVLSR